MLRWSTCCGPPAGRHSANRVCDPAVAHHLVVALGFLGGEQAAPQALAVFARHLDHRHPAVRVRAIAAVAQAHGRFEVVRHRDDVEALRPREAVERHAHRLAHDAAPAVGADQIAPAMGLDAAVRHAHVGLGEIRALPHLDHLGGTHHREGRIFLRCGQRDVDRAMLLELDHVGIFGFVREHAVVELGDHLAGYPVAPLEHRRFQSEPEDFRRESHILEQIERGRLQGRGAMILGRLVEPVEHRHRDAELSEPQAGHGADRAAARDQDAIMFRHPA